MYLMGFGRKDSSGIIASICAGCQGKFCNKRPAIGFELRQKCGFRESGINAVGFKEGVYYQWMELFAAVSFYFFYCIRFRQGFFVGAVGGHGVKSVRNRDNCGYKRDLIALQ